MHKQTYKKNNWTNGVQTCKI